MNKMKNHILIYLLVINCALLAQSQWSVTNTNDSGLGSLRAAIANANGSPGTSTITFSISGSGPHTITLLSNLQVHVPVIIDGGPKALNGEPNIHIQFPSSNNIPQLASIILFYPGSTIKGITFSNMGNGIHFWNFNGDPTPANHNIENCVFYDMTEHAIWFYFAANCNFKGNYFGTNRAKNITSVQSNFSYITDFSSGPSSNIKIGGTSTSKNYFYNCRGRAIYFHNNSSSIQLTNNEFVNNKLNFDIGYGYLDDNLPTASCTNGANSCKHSPIVTQAILSGNFSSNITISGTASAAGDVVEVYKSNNSPTQNGVVGRDASKLIGTATAGADKKWTFTKSNTFIGLVVGDVVTAIGTDAQGNSSQFGKMSAPVSNPCLADCPSGLTFSMSPFPFTIDPQTQQSPVITFTNTSQCNNGVSFTSHVWEIKHIQSNTIVSLSGSPVTHTFTKKGNYIVKLTANIGANACVTTQNFSVGEQLTCDNCISSFAPAEGEYIISAWVKQENAPLGTLTYSSPEIDVYFPSNPNDPSTNGVKQKFYSSGDIIDGWQRIEGELNVPNATFIVIELLATSGSCFYDDIRVHPRKASMTSYVYDPLSLKLVAELDQRNYATFYNYDEEGRMLRVKKETQRGIMTTTEGRNNNVKK